MCFISYKKWVQIEKSSWRPAYITLEFAWVWYLRQNPSNLEVGYVDLVYANTDIQYKPRLHSQSLLLDI